MNSESELLITIWDSVKQYVPSRQQQDVALILFKALEEFGIEGRDLGAGAEEDDVLQKTYNDLYNHEDEDEDDNDFDDYYGE